MWNAENTYNNTFTISMNQQSMPVLFFEFNKTDNVHEHFWENFISALISMNLDFTDKIKEMGMPVDEVGRELFFDELCELTKDNPLTIIFFRKDLIEDMAVNKFIKKLEIYSYKMKLQVVFITPNSDSPLMQFEQIELPNVMAYKPYLTAEEEYNQYAAVLSDVSEENLRKSRNFTNGWRAAVELVTANLKRYGNNFFADFDHLLQGWMENICNKYLTDDEVSGLIFVSLLDGFTADLVAYLLEWNEEHIASINYKNPVIRYVEQNTTFKVCDYFQPYIQNKAILLDNKYKYDMFIKTGNWYKQQGQIIEAINTFRRVGAFKKILPIILQEVYPSSMEMASCYLRTLGEMPYHFFEKNPVLEVVKIFCLGIHYRYPEQRDLAVKFIEKFDQGNQTKENLERHLGRVYLMKLHADVCTDIENCYPKILYGIKRAAELMSKEDMLNSVNFMKIYSDASAVQLPSPRAGSVEKFLKYMDMVTSYMQHDSREVYRAVNSLARAEFFFYQRKFNKVEHYARIAIIKGIQYNRIDVVCGGCFLLMRYFLAKNDLTMLLKMYEQLKDYAAKYNPGEQFNMPDIATAWLELMIGDMERVPDWIRNEALLENRNTPWYYGRDKIMRCFYLLREQDFESLYAYAKSSEVLFQKRSYYIFVSHMMLMQAISLHKMGEREKSARKFEEVYHWVSGNELDMMVVEYERYIRPLAKNCLELEDCIIPVKWLDEVTRKAKSYQSYLLQMRKGYLGEKNSSYHNTIKNLTTNEFKVLENLVRGMTAPEIAESMDKSLAAVKGTIRRVYEKLGAKNKTEAINIALEEQILKNQTNN